METTAEMPITDNTAPAPQVDIALMINEAVDRITIVVEEKLVAFENRIETKFISRAEFDELRNRFNAYPPKPANLSDIEEVFRELDKVKAENNLLKGQVGQAIGGQTELRDSIRNMRDTAEAVERQGAKMESTSNLLIGTLTENRSTMQIIHAEQQVARTDREETRKKIEEVRETANRAEKWIIDTDSRFERTMTRVHDMLHGNEDTGQIGLPKQLETLSKSITEVNEKLDQHREAMKPTVERVESWNKFGEFLVNKVGRAITIRLLFALLGALGLGGAFLAIISQALNGVN